jgi:hypothetical protein
MRKNKENEESEGPNKNVKKKKEQTNKRIHISFVISF